MKNDESSGKVVSTGNYTRNTVEIGLFKQEGPKVGVIKNLEGNNFYQNLDIKMTKFYTPNEVLGLNADVLTLKNLAEDDKLWVGDTGASCHMAKTKKGLTKI